MPIGPEQDPYGPRDAEGWYTWNGDETMRPAGKVDYVCRYDSPGFFATTNADHLRWNHDHIDGGGDVTKWRPHVPCANANKGCLRPKLIAGPYCDQCEPDL